jgi:hypothetical protein
VSFFYVQPEVAGATVSGTPPRFVCTFDSWLGDDLVRAQPLFLVTTPLLRALSRLEGATGLALASCKVEASEFYRHSGRPLLPHFWFLRSCGVPGCDDVAVNDQGVLVVSQRVLLVMTTFRVERAVFAQYTGESAGAAHPEVA